MNIRAAKVNLSTHLVTYFQAAHDNLNAHAGHAHSAGIEVYSHVPPELAQEGLR
jgi:hypothetical protein